MELIVCFLLSIALFCVFWKTLIPLGVLFLGIISDGVIFGIAGAVLLWFIFNIKVDNHEVDRKRRLFKPIAKTGNVRRESAKTTHRTIRT